jgi:ubiquinone/menaquinone biosynthesis C-methylase UbiE
MELAPGIVLDAGGGTGRISALLSQRPGLVPLLMDRSPEMLGQARSSHPELRAIRAEFGRIPLPDQSTTAVVCSLALTHTGDLAAAIAEFGRTLRPDGRVLICDIHPSAVSLGWQAFFRHASGQDVFLRNVLFSMSEYFTAFNGADLEVTGLSEIFFDQDSIRIMGERDPLAATVLAEAFDGLPALVVWEARPRSRRGARTAAPPRGGHPGQGPDQRG